MATIEREEQAHRLARAIVADIVLYHQAAIHEGAPLVAEIEEGRRLFYSRVRPELRPVFEAVLASSVLVGRGAAPAAYYEPPNVLRDEGSRSSNASLAIVIGVAVLLVAIAAAFFLMRAG